MQSANEAAGWRKTKALALATLTIGAFAGFSVPFFHEAIEGISVLGMPLGTLVAAVGAPIVFLLVALWFTGCQDAIERRHGVAEDD